jgi:teichuronic acid biosynthesis glycosyltransferase TuaC
VASLTNPAPLKATPSAPLHILTLTPFFPSLENDVNGCFVKEPLDRLTELGFSSTVIAATPLHHPRRHSIASAPATWVRYPQFPGLRGLSTAGRFLYARLLPIVSKLHREQPVHLIHAHAALPCGRAAAHLAQRLNIAFVVSVHGLDVFNDCFATNSTARSLRQASIDVYQSAQTVICVSGKVRQVLQEGMPSVVNSAVVQNGANPELFSPDSAPATHPQELLAVGNLIPSKGQELILRAIHRLTPDFPNLECRIIGEGPDRSRLESLSRELGLGQRVHLLGRQSRAAVADAMRRCSIFVLPSRSEGLGCVYLEAMSCAKPVVACRGQGIEEVIHPEQNGWLISPDSLEELVQSISTLLQFPEVSHRIGEQARETILTSFTFRHQAQRLAQVYKV